MGFGPKQGKGGAAMARALNKTRTKRKPDVRDLETVANVLRGVAMHLAVIAKRSGVDIAEPNKAILDCIDKIDAYTEARTTCA